MAATATPILLPVTPSTGWMRSQGLDNNAQENLIPALFELLNGSGYPTQTSPGTSTGNNWKAFVDTNGGSKFTHDGSSKYTCVLEGNTTGEEDRLSIGTTSFNPSTSNRMFGFKIKPTAHTGANGGLFFVGWFNSASINLDDFLGCYIDPANSTNWYLSASESNGGTNTVTPMERIINEGTEYWVIGIASADRFVVIIYEDEYRTPVAAVELNNTIDSQTMNQFGIGPHSNARAGETSTCEIDDIWEDVITGSYPTNQPPETFVEHDSKSTDSVTDFSTFDADGINKEFQHSVVDTAGVPTFNGTWLSKANLQLEADATGQYTTFKVRPTTTDGTTPVILTEGTIDIDLAASVPPKPDGIVVSDPMTDGDLTITWSNSGSYASGDVMMAHDKDASNAILGGGDATAGTMRISNLTNNQKKNILLRAVRP